MSRNGCALTLHGDTAQFTTDGMSVEIRAGTIVGLFSRLTGSTYIGHHQSDTTSLPSGLVYVESRQVTGDQVGSFIGKSTAEEGVSRLEPVPVPVGEMRSTAVRQSGRYAVDYTFETEDAALVISYELDPDSGDLVVTQHASGRRGSLSAVRFGLGPVVCRGNLLLPAYHGMKANRTKEFYRYEPGTRWEWPTGWPLPLAIFADALGGLWIHTQDAAKRFKALDYRYLGAGTWGISFDTINFAPFAPHTSAESVSWRVNVYEGAWTVPVDRYRAWAFRAFDMEAKAYARPSWIRDLKLVIKRSDHVVQQPSDAGPYLDVLKEYVRPAETLLLLKGGPDTPTSVAFNREARSRGFKTMYFQNYFAVFSSEPIFQKFQAHFVHDAYTQAEEGWNLNNEWGHLTDVKLYYVNPAYKPWRDHKIGMFKAMFDENPADGIFIDQSLAVYNDNNGLIDGQSMVDGNLAIQRELSEALPGVAIGGEGINEISFQYQSLCEFHILSLEAETDDVEPVLGLWKLDPSAFDRMVPIMSRFLEGYTRPMGYHVGNAEHPYYEAWRDAISIYGGVPTVSRPTADELRDPNSQIRRVIGDAFGAQ